MENSKVYTEMVRNLAKPGDQILSGLDGEKAHLWHMATGVSSEGGEVLDCVKKHVVYGQELDRENLVEELGDLEFFMEAIRDFLGVTRREVLFANWEKLQKKRYKDGYSDEAAQRRDDKQ